MSCLITRAPLAALAALVLASATSAPAQSLTTIYARNNGGSNGGAVYFDVNVLNPLGMWVTSFDTNTLDTLPMTLSVYLTPNTHVGNETNPALWVRIANGAGTGQGANFPTPVDTSDFFLSAGNYGIALVVSTSVGHDYTNGTGTNEIYANTDLRIVCGGASNTPFVGGIFTPRVWNGTLYYSAGGNHVPTYGVYGSGCAGTNGLAPRLSGTAPRIGNAFAMTVGNIPTSALAAFVSFGFSKDTFNGLPLPFDLGVLMAPGCWLLADMALTVPVIPGAGTASLTVPVGPDPGLLWARIYNQAFVLDPGANGANVTTSNGGEGTIGM